MSDHPDEPDWEAERVAVALGAPPPPEMGKEHTWMAEMFRWQAAVNAENARLGKLADDA